MPYRKKTTAELEALKRLGQNIRGLRCWRSMTQLDLSKKSGIHRPTITLIEEGKQQPSIVHLLKLSIALDCGLEALFTGVERWYLKHKASP